MRWRNTAILACALFAALPAAGRAAEDKLPEKELTGPLGRDLVQAARGAARLGIRHLEAVQKKNEYGVWFSPIDGTTRIPIGWKTVSVTRPVYKTVTKIVPVRKHVGWKWEWVTEKNPDDPYAPVGRKRVKKPVYKYIKQKKEVRVRDGDKTHVVEERRRIYQESDPYLAFARWLEGINALALYTLLRSGAAPDSEPVTRAAGWLHDGTQGHHGLPDTTYEVSLFVLAFCRLDRETYGEYVHQLLEKLLAGQIQKGECRGLWGIYSVDLERLKELQIKEMKGVVIRDRLAKEMREWKQELAGARSRREKARLNARIERNQKLHDRVMEELKKLRELILALSREFSRGSHWARRRRTERIGGDIRFYPGAFYDARFSRRGDLANTHLALLALRDAARHGYLEPDSPHAEHLTPVLARAANALKTLQEPDGSWGYGVREYHAKAPKKPFELPQNTNEPCLDMTAAGLAGLNAIAEVAGRARVLRGFAGTLDKARAAACKHLHAYGKRGLEPDLPISTQYTALYYYFTLATALDDPGLDRTRLGLIPQGVLCRVLFAQDHDGSWPKAPKYSFGTGKELRKRLGRRWRYNNTYEIRFDHQLVNTCFATLLLIESAQPTLGGVWHWSGRRNIEADLALAKVRDELQEECPLHLRWRSITGELPGGLAAFVPALILRGGADPDGRLAVAKDRWGAYLDEGGLLVVQTPAGTEGDAFAANLKDLLEKRFDDLKLRPLPEGHPAFGYSLKLRKLSEPVPAAWRGDRLVAVFLREKTRDGDGLAPGDVANLTRNVLAARSKVKDLRPTALLVPTDAKEVEKTVEAALARIKEEHIEVPEEPEPEGPKPPPEKKPDEPAKEPEKPKPPEKEPAKEQSIENLLEEIHKPPEKEPDDKDDRPDKDEEF
jgi:hypothetical protein